jgi:Ca2+/Na+ antiporter
MLLCIALVAGLGLDGQLAGPDGWVLLVAWFAHHVTRIRAALPRGNRDEPEDGLLPDPFLIGLGALVVVAAGWWAVDRTGPLSGAWGVDPVLVGLLVLGVGASLPELVLALSAATEGRAGLSPASVLATGLQGLLLPLGLVALTTPIPVGPLTLTLDLPALALMTAGLWAWNGSDPTPTRGRAVGLLMGYVVYALARMVLS